MTFRTHTSTPTAAVAVASFVAGCGSACGPARYDWTATATLTALPDLSSHFGG